MTPQQAYRIDWRKIVSDALPSFLRKPLIISLLLASIAPLIWLYHRFFQARLRDFYKLQHNGQVCSLLGVLEEQYPSSLGLHYRIEDVKRRGTVIYTHSEKRTNVPVAYPEGNRKVLTPPPLWSTYPRISTTPSSLRCSGLSTSIDSQPSTPSTSD